MNYPDIEYPGLGMLRYNPANEWYQGQLVVEQSAVTIYFSMDDEERLESSLERFAGLKHDLAQHVQRAQEYAVDSLLAVKNEMWIESSQARTTPEQVKDKMVLSFITIYSDGDVSFYWSDDDLLTRHFLATMDRKNNFISVEFPD
jgi:hypothetical protein